MMFKNIHENDGQRIRAERKRILTHWVKMKDCIHKVSAFYYFIFSVFFSFYKRVKEQSSILHDQPQTPLERAIYWVEYVIRHKGAHYLKPASVYLPFHQYILLDIIAVITIALTLFSVFLWKIIKFLYSYCAKHKPQESNLRKLLKKRN